MVGESRLEGFMHALLNATFIAFIPKVDNPTSMDDFKLILLCKCIYKIISKVIARRIKEILSKMISKEQFYFLEG